MRFTGTKILLKNWSISRRLSLWYSLSILILLGLFAVITYAEFHKSIHADFDQHLKHETSLLLPLLAIDGEAPDFRSSEALNSTAYKTTGIYATYVRILSPDAEVMSTSPNFVKDLGVDAGILSVTSETTQSRDWDGLPIRTMYTPLIGRNGSASGWLEVSGVEWAIHRQLDWLIRTYLVGIIVSTILAFGGGFILAKRALQPVEEITIAAKNIRATDLGARLPTRNNVNDEITRLARTINDLLSRLEGSIRREQRFISNATHELLTPLTTLRGELDLARRETDDQEMIAALNESLDDIDRMEQIIRSLLSLSRAENLKSAPRQKINLGQLCHEHINRFRDRSDIRGIDMTISCAEDLFVEADPVHIGTVLDNLLDNALKYTPDDGSISVRSESVDDMIRIFIDDTGHGFSAETADRLFDRFFRANEVEIQTRPGSGLGLAIARAIVEAYDGNISGNSRGPGKGARFRVEFPRAAEYRATEFRAAVDLSPPHV